MNCSFHSSCPAYIEAEINKTGENASVGIIISSVGEVVNQKFVRSENSMLYGLKLPESA